MKFDKKQTFKTWLTDQGLTVLILTALTIFSGILLSDVQSRLGMPILLVALVFVLCIYSIIILLMQRPISQLLTNSMQDIKEQLIRNSISFIIDVNQLADRESKMP